MSKVATYHALSRETSRDSSRNNIHEVYKGIHLNIDRGAQGTIHYNTDY